MTLCLGEGRPESLRDVSLLESAERFPLRLVFWRRARETRTRHSNPLLVGVPGVSIRSFRQDLLHGLYLGIGLDFCGSVLWLFVNENVFAKHRTQHESLTLTVLAIRSKLWAWYGRQRALGVELTLLEDLQVGMLGTKKKPILSVKAAECKGLIHFCVELLNEYIGELGSTGNHKLALGKSLVKIIDTMSVAGRVMTTLEHQTLRDNYVHVARFWKEAGLKFKPKMHAFAHLVRNVPYSGNPAFHATFLDESENRVLAEICRSAHRQVFEYRVFAHYNAFVKLKSRSAKSRRTK